MDKLDQVVAIQKAFADRFINLRHMTESNRDKWLDKMATCITEEASELRRLTNWKHVDNMGWSKKKKPLNVPEAKKEVMDLLAFTLEAALILAMDADEIFAAFAKKVEENHDRQQKGY